MTRILIFFLLIFFKTEAQTSVLKIADSLYITGNYTKAIETYKTHKNQFEVFNKIAKAYIAIGNYDEALKNYEHSVKANPNDVLVKYDYGKLLSITKKYDESAKVFNNLIELDEKNPNYRYELGLVLEQKNDSTAINQFLNVYELDRTHQKSIYKIAKYYLEKGKHNDVDTYVNIGLETYPNNLELISLKSQSYYWRQNYREAIKWFEKLLELGESSNFIYEKLSECYEKHYDYKKALENRLLVLKNNPNDATSRYAIGTYYLELNDFKNAEKYISDALLILDRPLDVEYIKLSTALNRQKKYKESVAALKKAVIENPSNEMSHFQLAMTLASYYEDYDAKLKAYEDFKKKFPNSGINTFVDVQISKIKEEKFIKEGEKKD